MLCTNCGLALPNDSKFCSKCGTKLENDANVGEIKTDIDKIDSISSESSDIYYNFLHRKSLGSLIIKMTGSDATFNNNSIDIEQQKVFLYFFKKAPKKIKVNIPDIKLVQLKKDLDISDLIFGSIFLIFGLLTFAIPLLLISGLLLWSGSTGKRIEIKTSNDTIKIPFDGSKKDAHEFFKNIESINPNFIKSY